MPFEENTNVDGGIAPESETLQKQRRQMHIALALLLTALVVVVVKDRQFWLGSAPAIEDSADEATPDQTADDAVTQTATATSAPHSSKSKSRSEHTAAVSLPAVPSSTIVASNRAALPPLEIEDVAGGQHQTVQATNHSVKVDLQANPDAPSAAAASAGQTNSMAPGGANLATNAGERVRLSPDTAQMVERPVEPNYPMLAKQMKVQGSVVLQALIGREGAIQDLRVLSGPVILSTAAMDAVRQWRFRPYYEAGQPVETEARITVNFTISTW
jgi:TonB family protein